LGNLNLNGYYPQKKFGKEEFYNKQLGDTITLRATVGGTGNLYQWYKDGNMIQGKTAITLNIASLALTDQGPYICKVVNLSVPKLTLESKVMSIFINRVLVANAGIDQSVNEGATVTLDGSSSRDADGNAVTYQWTAPIGITLSSATEAKPTFTASEVTADTIYTISLVVNDRIMDSPADQVVITVLNVDHASYVQNAIPDVSAVKGTSNQIIDLNTIFADEDVSDVLSYVVTSNSNSEVISATIKNSTLTLSFSTVNTGTSEIVITASSNGKDVQLKFKVEVKLPTGIDGLIDEKDVQIYPNPTTGIVHLKFNKTPKIGSWITVLDLSGKTIFESEVNEKEELINLSGNTPGIYFIQFDSKSLKTFKIILK